MNSLVYAIIGNPHNSINQLDLNFANFELAKQQNSKSNKNFLPRVPVMHIDQRCSNVDISHRCNISQLNVVMQCFKMHNKTVYQDYLNIEIKLQYCNIFWVIDLNALNIIQNLQQLTKSGTKQAKQLVEFQRAVGLCNSILQMQYSLAKPRSKRGLASFTPWPNYSKVNFSVGRIAEQVMNAELCLDVV